MTDNPTGPELFAGTTSYLDDINDGKAEYESVTGKRVDNRMLYAMMAQATATQANTAMLKVIAELVGGSGSARADMMSWDKVIPVAPLENCLSKEDRRPECAERHTEDCDYADPPPKLKHVLLPVGTRVLVSDPHGRECDCNNAQPYVGKIAGYDMSRSKYQINEERYGRPGEYYNFVRWAFADNRVEVHPDGPECPAPDHEHAFYGADDDVCTGHRDCTMTYAEYRVLR